MEAKIQPKDYKGGFLGFQERLKAGILKNPMMERIMSLKASELNDFYAEKVCFEDQDEVKYYRIIEIFCDDKKEQKALANMSRAYEKEKQREKNQQ